MHMINLANCLSFIFFFSLTSCAGDTSEHSQPKTKKTQPSSQKTVEPKLGASMNSLLSIDLTTVNNKNIKLTDFEKTDVFLFVNTASECGFTSQYKGLEALHQKFKDKGFAVVGFPSNDFGAQEPGTNAEIKDFCKLNYGVTFPLMSKASVKGSGIQPFYKELISLSDDKSDVSWNFEKFLVTKDGTIKRYKSKTTPAELESEISKLL